MGWLDNKGLAWVLFCALTAFAGNSFGADANGFWLSFPLQGQTHATATINSVMDHDAGANYTQNGVVVAFDGTRVTGTGCLIPTYEHVNSCGYSKDGNPIQLAVGVYAGGGDDKKLFYEGHPGIDYRAPMNTPVYATADGVLSAGGSAGTAILDHGNGYRTLYLHLDFIEGVTPRSVSRSEKIGESGRNGPPGTPPHLHLQIEKGGIPVDPYGWSGTYADPWIAARGVTNVDLWTPVVGAAGSLVMTLPPFSGHPL